MTAPGTLYLVPTALGGDPAAVIPSSTLSRLHLLRYFVVENEKSAHRFLKAAGYPHPELLVLTTGAGSLILSHVNDGGFWLVKEYFNMSVAQTFKTWTVLETLVSVVALLLTAALAMPL